MRAITKWKAHHVLHTQRPSEDVASLRMDEPFMTAPTRSSPITSMQRWAATSYLRREDFSFMTPPGGTQPADPAGN